MFTYLFKEGNAENRTPTDAYVGGDEIRRHIKNRLFYLNILYIKYKMSGLSFDFSELIKRAIKYIIEGIMVAIAAYAIPKKSLNVEEIVVIGLMAAATFAVLDVFLPSIASSARGGAGFGIGANLVGFPRMM
jgi:uncharacterized membrane protein